MSVDEEPEDKHCATQVEASVMVFRKGFNLFTCGTRGGGGRRRTCEDGTVLTVPSVCPSRLWPLGAGA